jgi:hypothetical protein
MANCVLCNHQSGFPANLFIIIISVHKLVSNKNPQGEKNMNKSSIRMEQQFLIISSLLHSSQINNINEAYGSKWSVYTHTLAKPRIMLKFRLSITQSLQNRLVSIWMSSTYNVIFKLYLIWCRTLSNLNHN